MKKIIFLYLFIVFTLFIHGNEKEKKYLFVNSYPLKAAVLVDNVDKGFRTPCLIQNINFYKTIIIEKDGYKPQKFIISSIKNKSLDVNLSSELFSLYFPEHSLYNINNTAKQGPFYLSNLKNGTYEITSLNNTVSFNKISPFLPAEAALGSLMGTSLIFMALSLGLAEYYRYEANTTYNDFSQRHFELVASGFDITSYVAISLTAVFVLAFTGILIADLSLRYKFKKENLQISNELPYNESEQMYNSAVDFLKTGEIEKSTKVLLSALSLYPESNLIPLYYYQLGQNYFILKQYEKALENWEIFINEYPIINYYDYVIKNIAEIHQVKGDLESALNIIDRIVYTENILDRENLLSFKASLIYEMYEKTNNDEHHEKSVNSYLVLISSFPESERLDFYYSVLIKLYKTAGQSDKLNELKQKAGKIEQADLRNLILSYF